MAGYKDKGKTQGVIVEQNGPSESTQARQVTDTQGGTHTNAGVDANINQSDPRPDPLPSSPITPLGSSVTPVGERVVVNLRDNKPLVDRTLNTVIRKVIGNINETSATEILAGLNQAETAVAGRAGSQSEFSAFSFGATSTTGQSVAQMSLYERALAALSDAERRLGALRPMQTPEDPENLDALRAITLATYRRLVTEFGRSGGPRVDRVGMHFDVLIANPDFVDPLQPNRLDPNGLLGKIQAQFKIDSGVNTAEDNVNRGNFRIVKDNLFAVHNSWKTFTKDRTEDFGEQSANFSRLLTMIQDDVADVESAMDDVNFDEADRDSQPIQDPSTDDTITIQGLLSWISEFAAEEGPEMVDHGGALGIAATHPTLGILEKQVKTLMGLEEAHVKAPNVDASLKILLNHLNKAASLAEIVKKAIKQ